MILFPDGQKVYAEGADDADVGRGYNAAGAVLDEVCKWIRPYESWWEGILPSLRADLINDHPRAFVATTPKPIKIIQEWVASTDGSVHLMGGSTFDNAVNLSSYVLVELEKKYRGTAIGQQELYGKVLELNSGGLFRRMDIVNHRVDHVPADSTIASTVVGMDPNLTGEEAETGLVAACRTTDGEIYILADRTIQGSGRQAALAAWRAVSEFDADVLVYEENLGKRYLQEVLQDAYREYCDLGMFPAHTSPPMKPVHAKHGKKTRAEPVAMRAEQGRLHFVGHEMETLEDQCVMFDPLSAQDSPDRMDAMVHACIWLMAGERKRMKIGKPGEGQMFPGNFYDLNQFGPQPVFP
jgi:phage terminase large subunit-like protein